MILRKVLWVLMFHPKQDQANITKLALVSEECIVFSAICNKYIMDTFCSICPAAAAAKLLQSCPTLCDPIDSSPPGFPIPGILQARTLEWVAISFSNAWKWKVKVKSLSHVQLFTNPWTAAYQAPPSMGFSRQKYWSGVPLPSLSICPQFPNSSQPIPLTWAPLDVLCSYIVTVDSPRIATWASWAPEHIPLDV